jgi:hypothetical protein
MVAAGLLSEARIAEFRRSCAANFYAALSMLR